MNQAVNYEIPEYRVKMVADRHVPFERRPKITTADDAVNLFRAMIPEDEMVFREHVLMLMVNPSGRVIGTYRVATGGTGGCVLDPKVVMQTALSCMASAIILCHNHPSGSLRPSRSDEKITQRIKEACKLLDIDLLDHLIITAEGCYSMEREREL